MPASRSSPERATSCLAKQTNAGALNGKACPLAITGSWSKSKGTRLRKEKSRSAEEARPSLSLCSHARTRMSIRAYIFPGQGSQFSGMGSELAEKYGAARAVFEEADEALGFSISRICF